MSSFAGFPVAALDFYDDLEIDNSKSFWEANKHIYAESVLAPMRALTGALAPEFGDAKIFRPYRDVRFAKDKTPYKTHQGAFVAVAPATGWYVELSAAGLRVGGGFYEASGPRLAQIRAAIDDDKTGRQLARLVAAAVADGFELGGDQLKTAPRGYPKEHPRITLLRHRQLFLGRPYGFDNLDRSDLSEDVRADWAKLRPLLEWFARIE